MKELNCTIYELNKNNKAELFARIIKTLSDDDFFVLDSETFKVGTVEYELMKGIATNIFYSYKIFKDEVSEEKLVSELKDSIISLGFSPELDLEGNRGEAELRRFAKLLIATADLPLEERLLDSMARRLIGYIYGGQMNVTYLALDENEVNTAMLIVKKELSEKFLAPLIYDIVSATQMILIEGDSKGEFVVFSEEDTVVEAKKAIEEEYPESKGYKLNFIEAKDE